MLAEAVPYGYCECGCGRETTRRDRIHDGYQKGEPRRFCQGHSGVLRRVVSYEARDCGYATPCWVWTSSYGTQGYGRVSVRGQRVFAHRYIYEQSVGPIPEGRSLDHLCRNRGCVNPEHLEPVSHAENCRRGGRTKLTYELVEYIRSSPASVSALARELGVGETTIRHVLVGASWRDVA